MSNRNIVPRARIQGARNNKGAKFFVATMAATKYCHGHEQRLEFIFFERLERRRSGPESVVFGYAVEDVDAAVVEQGGLGYGAPGAGGTD